MQLIDTDGWSRDKNAAKQCSFKTIHWQPYLVPYYQIRVCYDHYSLATSAEGYSYRLSLSVRLSVSLSVRLSFCLSVRPSVFLSVCLSAMRILPLMSEHSPERSDINVALK